MADICRLEDQLNGKLKTPMVHQTARLRMDQDIVDGPPTVGI
ncbi:MAG TPA: hypothetical protein VMM84_00655 [Pyrinomonadaceae bacterium]|nr:hypothetical protein [Pyrinomonadaceae bacterium]